MPIPHPSSFERVVGGANRTNSCTGANANAIWIYRRSCCISCRFRGSACAGRQCYFKSDGRRCAQGRQRPLSDERLSRGDGAPGRNVHVNLRLQNYDMAPERLALSVSGVPAGWTATLLGGGQPVAAAMPATNSSVSLSLRLDVPKNAPMGTQTLTVAATGNVDEFAAADRRDARQGSAGQADGDAAASRIARQFEVELRISARHQERQRQETHGEPVRPGAGEFRHLVHRAIRHPGTQRGADRRRPDQGREAQSDAAEYRGGRRLQGHGAGRGGGCLGNSRSRSQDHRPAEARCQRPRGPGVDARVGRQGDVGSGRHHQYRHRARRRYRSSPARRRADGKSPSIRRRSIALRQTTTRKCRR